MVATVVMRLADAHRVVREVHIAVVAEKFGHRGAIVLTEGSAGCEV